MKRIAVLTILVTMVLGLMIVGPSMAQTGRTTITFWHGMGAQLGKTLDELVAQFNAENPNILVKAEYQGNYGALSQKIVGALVARKPPTMSQVYGNWADEYISANELVPMEKFIKGPDGLTQLEIDDIWEGLRKASMFNGVWYTMPFNKSVYVLVYNKRAFQKVGLTAPPQNWQELVDYANKLTIREGDKVVQYGLGLRPNIDMFACFYFNAGGEWMDSAGKVVVNNAAGVRTLQYMVDLLNRFKVAYYIPGYLDADFGAGKVAMYFTSSPGLSYTDSAVAGKFDWGAAPLPYLEPRFRATPVAGTDIAIFARATAAEQAAAWKFTKWLIEPRQTAKWAIGTSYIPVRKSALHLAMMREHFQKFPRNEESLKQLNYIKYDPNISAWNAIRGDISEAVEKAFLGKASPKEALDEAVAKANRRL